MTQCRWFIRHHKDCTNNRKMKCHFWPEIREMKQDGTLWKILLVIPLRVNGSLHRYQQYMWYQDDICLDEHILVGPLKCGHKRDK